MDSAPGHGSCFRVALPYRPAADSALQPAAETGGQSAIRRRLAGIHLLVVEDNDINRLVLEDNLRAEGATVDCVGDGQQAVELLQTRAADFDAILMDVMMPVMDGYEATRMALRIDPDLRIIGQTAHAFGAEREACFAAGMVDHIAKPIDPEALVGAVLRHARRAAAPVPNAIP